jgi:glycosyltransferase involved in cell wall biosynthesis
MPEVAGDAALLVDPRAPGEIAAAMLRLLEDKNLTTDLIEAGRKRREAFSWERSAEKVWEVLSAAARS